MTGTDPYKVEVEDGLLKITTMDGAWYYYHQDDKGTLTLGFPYFVTWQSYRIKLFVPRPEGLPLVLNVEAP